MEFQNQQRARVSFAAQERYRILVDGAEFEAVPAGTLRWDGTLPAVGDWVDVRMASGGLGVIENVLPRATAISRRQAGRSHDEQVLAANVDLIVVVMALDRDFNLRRLERYLVLAAESGAATLIALNKAELCEDPGARMAEISAIAPDIACVTLSAIESVEPLLPYMEAAPWCCWVLPAWVSRRSSTRCLASGGRLLAKYGNTIRAGSTRPRSG